MKYLLPALLFFSFQCLGQSLRPGDVAVLGIVANNFDCTGVPSGDEISFVSFRDIMPGTTIDLTDNGWERCQIGRWGDSEGAIRFTRTGNTIPAGTVITYQLTSAGSFGSYFFITPDNDWSVQNLNMGLPPATSVNLNVGGDQLFFLSGGNWQNGGINNDNDAIYTGEILFGFNTKSLWQANCTSNPTQNSNLPPELVPCYKMEPTSGMGDFSKYTGPLSPAAQIEWIDRIKNPANWTFFSNCTDYQNTAPFYSNTLKINVLPAQFGIVGGPNGVCAGDTALIELNLPIVGAPFIMSWSDGKQTFFTSGLEMGDPLMVVPTKSAIFSINSLSDAQGCAVLNEINSNFFLEVYPKDTFYLQEKTCRISEVGYFSETMPSQFGCDSVVFRQVTFDTLNCAVEFSFSKTDISCFGNTDGTITILPTKGTQPFDYQINNLQTGDIWNGEIANSGSVLVLENLPKGDYQIRLLDQNGIEKIQFLTISEDPPLRNTFIVLSDYNGFPVSCKDAENGRVRANISGGLPPYLLNWSNGEVENIADFLPAGWVRIAVTDSKNCSLEDSIFLTVPDSLMANFSAVGESCAGRKNGNIEVSTISGGLPPYSFALNQGPFQDNGTWENLPAGFFSILVRDNNFCGKTFSVTLPEGTGYNFSMGTDTCIFSGDSISRQPITSRKIAELDITPRQFATFDTTSGEVRFHPVYSSKFYIVATDTFGCVAHDTIVIDIKKDRAIFLPNIFNPTAPKIENQRFTVFTDGGVREVLSFQIFNRFGGLVFERKNFLPNDPTLAWDGKENGQNASVGIYVWHLRVLTNDSRELTEKGSVLLMR